MVQAAIAAKAKADAMVTKRTVTSLVTTEKAVTDRLMIWYAKQRYAARYAANPVFRSAYLLNHSAKNKAE